MDATAATLCWKMPASPVVGFCKTSPMAPTAPHRAASTDRFTQSDAGGAMSFTKQEMLYPASRLNFLWVLMDCTRPSMDPESSTPRLDAIAAGGRKPKPRVAS
jgi:hypothetical protein